MSIPVLPLFPVLPVVPESPEVPVEPEEPVEPEFPLFLSAADQPLGKSDRTRSSFLAAARSLAALAPAGAPLPITPAPIISDVATPRPATNRPTAFRLCLMDVPSAHAPRVRRAHDTASLTARPFATPGHA